MQNCNIRNALHAQLQLHYCNGTKALHAKLQLIPQYLPRKVSFLQTFLKSALLRRVS